MSKHATLTTDLETLLREIQLYLAAVDVFRAAGYPPRTRSA
jgi:hypothetical protein